MSIIYYREQRANGDVELLCEQCMAATDWVTPYDAAMLAIRGYHILCMECDTLEADCVPTQLVPMANEYLKNGSMDKKTIRRYLSPLASSPYPRVFAEKDVHGPIGGKFQWVKDVFTKSLMEIRESDEK